MESFDEMRILDIRPAHVTDRAEWFRSPGRHSGLSGELKAKKSQRYFLPLGAAQLRFIALSVSHSRA
jgi:hypothetical protein